MIPLIKIHWCAANRVSTCWTSWSLFYCKSDLKPSCIICGIVVNWSRWLGCFLSPYCKFTLNTGFVWQVCCYHVTKIGRGNCTRHVLMVSSPPFMHSCLFVQKGYQLFPKRLKTLTLRITNYISSDVI